MIVRVESFVNGEGSCREIIPCYTMVDLPLVFVDRAPLINACGQFIFELFPTMFYTMNSSPLLVTKLVFMLTNILRNYQ